jgi:predicted DNA-binding protein
MTTVLFPDFCTVCYLCYTIEKKREVFMPTKNPGINVVLTPRVYDDVQTLSEARGLSMSSVVGDLIEDALEIQEDMALAALADERKKSLKKSELVSHKKAWS